MHVSNHSNEVWIENRHRVLWDIYKLTMQYVHERYTHNQSFVKVCVILIDFTHIMQGYFTDADKIIATVPALQILKEVNYNMNWIKTQNKIQRSRVYL